MSYTPSYCPLCGCEKVSFMNVNTWLCWECWSGFWDWLNKKYSEAVIGDKWQENRMKYLKEYRESFPEKVDFT